MRLLATILGTVLLLGVIWDTMETMVLPRAAVRHWRLTRMFYRLTWAGWTGLARRTPWLSTLLSLYGPISLLVLLVFWAGMLVFGFGLVHWGLGAHYSMHDVEPGLPALLYYSGTTFFTLGLGDITPLSGPARILSVLETGVGFGYLALVIGYLPVIYQSYSRRESVLSVLDARAGSPPTAAEMLRRTGQGHEPGSAFPGLEDDLRTWERWVADLMESHISYPVLSYYRSQHDGQSWIAALTTILDACSFLLTSIEDGPRRQAQLTYAIARHALVDLCLIFNTPPLPPEPDRLPMEDYRRLCAALQRAGLPIAGDAAAYDRLTSLRASYEPYIKALADGLLFLVPGWMPDDGAEDNWQSSAWDQGPHF